MSTARDLLDAAGILGLVVASTVILTLPIALAVGALT